ncbi:unnamed protein product [Withania somnifera]
MLCSFPLFVKPHYNRPILRSIDQAVQQKKSRNFNSNIGSSCYGLDNRPNPIRTCISTDQEKLKHQYTNDLKFYDSSLAKEKEKHDEDGFKRTKSRTSKIFSELKKVKQPISPGGRLSSFLNSLFTYGKKAKISSNDEEIKLKSANSSTSSSYSRSCLRKNITSTPCGHKNLEMYQQNVEAVKGINRNYVHENHELKFYKNIEVEDDDDGGGSCASSDLFELDIFSIGKMGLPVYETTNLVTNPAISANGN